MGGESSPRDKRILDIYVHNLAACIYMPYGNERIKEQVNYREPADKATVI